MSVGDVFRIVLTMRHNAEEESQNRFFYEQITGTSSLTSQDVMNVFINNILADLDDICPDTTTFERVQVINGHDNTDYAESNPSISGAVDANALAPFICVEMRSQWQGPGTRRGYKRFMAGYANVMDHADGKFTSGFQTLCAPLAAELGKTLPHADGTIRPVTITAPFVLGTPPVVNEPLSGNWEMDQWPSTQDSRKLYDWSDPNA